MESPKSYEGARILIADDEESLLNLMGISLEGLGAEIHLAHNGKEALALLEEHPFDLIISDQYMPYATGLDVLRVTRKLQPAPLFILVTGKGTIELAVDAMRNGAFHFIEKPFDIPQFLQRVQTALDTVQLAIGNRALRQAVESHYVFKEIIVGTSKTLHAALDLALRAAEQSSPVLLLGESGTGKDLFASAIHFHGPRHQKPFIPINCAAIPENLIESEFFGHKKGSFTGAIANRRGCFEEVAGGTLFLDEIGEMPFDMQVKLLRVLEEHKIRRVGDNTEIPVDFRIIAATNRPLAELVDKKIFRQDLYYRLNVLTILLPPLRERLEDIIPLAEHFLKKTREEGGTRVASITAPAMETLMSYHYPGNIRELINILERALLLCDADKLEPRHLPPELLARTRPERIMPGGDDLNLKRATQMAQEAIERQLIRKALEMTRGNHKRAAELLGISRGALYNKLEKSGLQRPQKDEAPS